MKINIADFEIEGIDQIIKDTGDLISRQNELKASNKQILKDTQNLTNATDDQRKKYVENNAVIKIASTQINANNKLLQAQTQSQRQLNDALTRNITSIDQARASNTELIKIRNSLNLSTQQGIAEAEKINQKIDENNSFIKENVSSLEQQKIGIGGYAEGIKEAFTQTSGFNTVLGTLQGAFNNLKPLYNAAKKDLTSIAQGYKAAVAEARTLSAGQRILATSTAGVNAALKLFKIALISTGIGAILVALGSLISFLSSTQRGIDTVNKVLIPLKAVFETLVGLFQQAGEFLFDAFSKPQKTLKQLADFIGNQLTKRFEGLASILKGLVTLNFDSIKEGVNQIGDANRQVIDQVKSVANQVGESLNQAVERGKQIASLQIQIEKGENNLILLRAESNRIIKEENKVAEDVTRSLSEREAAAEKAIELSQGLLAEEQRILDLKIEQLRIQQENNDTSREDEAELNKLVAERSEKETQALELQTTLTNKLNTIRREAIAEARKQAEEAIAQTNLELELFIKNEDQKNLKISERLNTIQQVEDRETEIQQQKLDNQLINQTEFELAILEIKRKSLEQQALLTIENLNQELDLFRANNQSKIDNNQRLTESLVNQEILRLRQIFEQQQVILQEQRQAGLITELEFQAQRQEQLNALNQNQRDLTLDLEDQRKAEDQERNLIDTENRRALEDEIFEIDSGLRLSRLEEQRQQELLEAEKTGANKELINKKFDIERLKQEEIVAQNKIGLASGVLNDLVNIFGKESEAGKAAAVAAISIDRIASISRIISNTGVANAKAVAASPLTGGQPFVSINSITAATSIGSAIASGAKAIGQIAQAEDGGLIRGKRHSQGGTLIEAEDGEMIMSRRATLAFLPELQNMQRSVGSNPGIVGNAFARDGGLVARSLSSENTSVLRFQEIIQENINTIQVVNDPLSTIEEANNVFEVENQANI